MRISTLSFTAAILIGLGLLSSNPTLRLPTAVAQVGGSGGAAAPPAATPELPSIPSVTPAKLPSAEDLARQSEAEMMAKLEQKIDVDFVDNSLDDVIDFLREKTGLQLLVDHTAKELVEAHHAETKVTLHLTNLPARRILGLILDQYELTYVPVEDGLVTITSIDAAEEQLLVRVYNCRDILYASPHFLGTQPGTEPLPSPLAGGMGGMGMPGMSSAGGGSMAAMMGGGMPGMPGGMSGMPGGMGSAPNASVPSPTSVQEYRSKRLMHLLTTTVNAGSWDETGGAGSVSEFDGLIVINQTAAVHQGIDNVLKMLRTAAEQTEKIAPQGPPAVAPH